MNKLLLRIAKYYWTFIASLIFKKRNRPKSTSRNILIAKFDGLGDFFILIPFFEMLHKNNYKIFCISHHTNSQVITHLHLNITFIPFKNSNLQEFRNLLNFVRTTDFEASYNLSMNIWGGILVNQSRSKLKIGLVQEKEHYVYKGANLFYDNTKSYTPSTHSFDVLQKVFTSTLNIQETVPVIHSEHNNSDYIVIHPYAKWPPRRWPRFPEFITELLAQNKQIRIIGTAKEHTEIDWPSSIKCNKGCQFITLDSVDHLMSEIDNCSIFIGNDSGPAHYAALTGKPTLVLWGPGYFERIHHRGANVQICMTQIDCRPCRQKGDICQRGKNECLLNISVSMAFDSLSSLQISERTNA
jgi:ADP-heptose:LPS heptosyltransferase